VTRFRLTIEYDGRPFMGWQRQDHGPSVQGSLERALLTTLGEESAVHAAGRTDAGVHARAMVAHVDIAREISAERLMGALNAGVRPDPVSVIACSEIDHEFHARFSCVARHYEYVIVNRRSPLALNKGLAWRVWPELDAAAMHDAAQRLVGRHDFTTFRSAHCQAESPIRTLDRLDVTRQGERILIHASARSFLHHQVRSMTGCLAMVGEGKWTADDLGAALMAKDRAALGFNAPPDGLYFIGADY
jgi:tRNA pseudouridine38-40 synthase